MNFLGAVTALGQLSDKSRRPEGCRVELTHDVGGSVQDLPIARKEHLALSADCQH